MEEELLLGRIEEKTSSPTCKYSPPLLSSRLLRSAVASYYYPLSFAASVHILSVNWLHRKFFRRKEGRNHR